MFYSKYLFLLILLTESTNLLEQLLKPFKPNPQRESTSDKINKEYKTITRKRKTSKPKKKFTILSADGGGCRGIVALSILKYLEIRAGIPLYEAFDLFAGTSVGSIVVGLLAVPSDDIKKDTKFTASTSDDIKKDAKFTASDMYNFGINLAKQLFTPTLSSFLSLGGTIGPQYSSELKRKIIKDATKDTRLSQTLTDIIVPTFDIRSGEPYLFKSSDAKNNSKVDYLLADVLDGSSAAPTYFYPNKVVGYDSEEELGYRSFLEGGIVVQNPEMIAVLEATNYYKVEPDDIIMISLGTGLYKEKIPQETAEKWGLLTWARRFPDFSLNSNVQLQHTLAKNFLRNDQYLRIDFDIDSAEHFLIDNASDENLDWLDDMGYKLIKKYKKELDKITEMLVEAAGYE